MNTSIVVIYTDGSCSHNNGAGGWAAIVNIDGVMTELSGGDTRTTSVRMELTAIIRALQLLTTSREVVIYTDCQFIVNTVNQGRLTKWDRCKYQTTKHKLVPNHELWIQLHGLLNKHDVRLTWIKGHSGTPLNDRCDKLAKQQMKARKDKTL